MSKPRIFIDGHAGTTGLRIRQWLAGREDILVSTLAEADRKSESARKQAMSEADLTILCLPDEAAEVSGLWADELGARILDASSAHRVAEGWVYGLPELVPGQRDAIRDAQKVSNPGCYPSAFLALIRPLIDAGQLAPDAPLSIHALSGYTGGGKSLIERWESPKSGLVGQPFESPYALDRIHKHIPEMQSYTKLVHAPQFVPAVGPFACGMRVQVPLHASLLEPGASALALWQTLADRYESETFVDVAAFSGHPAHGEPQANEASTFDEKTLDPTALNDTNRLRLHVSGNAQGHALLVGILDNLGKGASGVAIQNLNLMLGLPEHAGLPR